MLIINANILPMEGDPIENGFIQIEKGTIHAMGEMAQAPQDAEVYDAQGAYALPGFIDAHCHLGICGDSLGFEGDDCNEMTDPIMPQLRAIDGVNPMDRCFSDAAKGGVTTVHTGPGSANPIAGQFIAMKTTGRRIDTMALKVSASMKFALGENPKVTYNEKHETPTTRMATAALIREELYKAKEYMRKQQKAAEDEDTDAPDYDAKLEALVPVLKGELCAHFHAHRADDILTAIRIAKEFALDYVIVHGTEGHLIADILAEEGSRVICGPLMTDRSKPELAHQTIQNPGLLAQAGVNVAICTDHPVLPIEYLPLSAAMAVRAGMDKETALKAITITAAEIVGLSDRVGSLKVGKDADIVLCSTHPFELDCKVEAVFIDGKRV